MKVGCYFIYPLILSFSLREKGPRGIVESIHHTVRDRCRRHTRRKIQAGGKRYCLSVHDRRRLQCLRRPAGEEAFPLVRESHCLGHNKDRKLTVAEYRKEQGLNEYEPHTDEWRQLILKKKSAVPSIGKPSAMSLQLFFMASYNLDQFQHFVASEQFLGTYDLEPGLVDTL